MCGFGAIDTTQVATDQQAQAGGFPAVGELASTEDLQVLVGSNGSSFAFQDAGVIPQSMLTQFGISRSDAQNLTNAQVMEILNAQTLAAQTLAADPVPVASTPTAACDVSFFGDTSCMAIGSTTVGSTTALVIGGAGLLLLMMFIGKH